MRKRVLPLLLFASLALSSCGTGGTDSSTADGENPKEEVSKNMSLEESVLTNENSSFELLDGSLEGSEEDGENSSSDEEGASQIESESASDDSSGVSYDSESAAGSVDASQIESADDSSEYSSESSEDVSDSDSSYEVMDTPVIPVPLKLTSAEEDAFFNDSVFVGNSIMLGFQKFTNRQRAGSIADFLGNSKFFVAGSFGVYHNNRTPASKKDSCNPMFEGVKYSVEDAVGVMGVKTVYINFMGLNDLSLYYDADNCARKCADDVIKMIKKINERYPDVNVVILSATYLTQSTNTRPSLNNRNLSMLNNYLLEYCSENGLDFVDIASQLTENGCLADKYASDGYCHIWTDGYMVWTAILRDYAVRKMNGTYVNPERMPILGKN